MKPILFNTEMVRAILDGRKGATRRVADINPDIPCNHGEHEFVWDNFTGGKATGFVCRKCGYGVSPPHDRYPVGTSFFRPRYFPGDILYVRETWRTKEAGYPPRHSIIEYKAGGTEKFEDIIAIPTAKGEWKPSIHMPKEAARIFLRVKDVRVERLHEITMSGMMDEGVIPVNVKGGQWQQWQREYMRPVWDSTIKKADRPRSGWDANPWVWAIPFEQISKEEAIDNA